MAITLTPRPPAPNPNDPAGFPAKADAMVAWYGTNTTEMQAVILQTATDVAASGASAAAAAASQGSATASQIAAAASASSAAAAAGAAAWVSGTNYVAGVVVYSPLNLASYRRKTNGAGTVDPSLDSANWTSAIVITAPVPLGGAIWINTSRNNPGNVLVQEGYSYLKTGVLALKAAYPNYPSTYRLVAATTSPPTTTAYGGGFFGQKSMVIGPAVAVVADISSGVKYSSTGTAWSGAGVGSNAIGGLVYGAGVFVAYENASSANVYSSTNPASWANRAMPSTQPWQVSDYANGKFIAVSSTAGSTATATSSDGLTWVAGGATPAHSGKWRVPLRVGSRWVLIDGTSGGTVAYSNDDGATWSAGSGGTAISVGSVGTNGAKILIATSSAYATYRYTSDGATWADGTWPLSAAWTVHEPVDGRFLASAGGVTYWSADGLTWTSLGLSSPTIIKAGSVYYACLSTTSCRISTDFVTWSAAKESVAGPGAFTLGGVSGMLNGYLLAVPMGYSTTVSVTTYADDYTGEPNAITNGILSAYVRAT